MEFISEFLTQGIKMLIFVGIVIGGSVIGKKIRDKKDEKDAVL
jgi:hypothetical protein